MQGLSAVWSPDPKVRGSEAKESKRSKQKVEKDQRKIQNNISTIGFP